MGLHSKMSATAEELTEANANLRNNLSETAEYLPKAPSESGPEDPMGTPDMPKANSMSQAHGRVRRPESWLRAPSIALWCGT